uniref:Uncharacterized protein n=1 Tax=Meloidogyne hapla TaxID=6305 RepID=A0A1I8B7B7_MELHA
MSYSLNIQTNNKLTENIISGRRFDCEHLQILNKYKIADNYKIQQKITVKRPGNERFTFVTGASKDFFPTLRKLLYLLKQKFGCSQKIIGYDLGGISEEKNMMEELNSVCELEWRKFDWSIMPKDVLSPKAFSWKIHILAEIFTQYDTFIWMDTSINLEDAKYLDPIFEAIENRKISEMVFPGGMFTYIPILTDWIKIVNQKWDIEMYDANFIILHKSEYTRNLLKWALLCAATKQCIEPDGSELYCISPRTTIGTCHRSDQSVMGILNVNSEYKRSLLDKEFIPHFHPDHPRRKSRSSVQRREQLDRNLDFKKGVACCQQK